MTATQITALKAIVKTLILAEVASSWAGSQPAEDRPLIEADRKAAKVRFESYLQSLRS